jgi:hypothetical protein
MMRLFELAWGEGAFEFAPSRRRAKPPHPALSPGCAKGEGSSVHSDGTTAHCRATTRHLPFSTAGISLSPDSFTVGGEGWGEGAV